MRIGLCLLFLGVSLLCSADSLSQALKEGRFQTALEISDSLLPANPASPALWTARGFALAGLKQDKQSLSAFEAALRYSPDFLAALKGAVEVSYRSHDARTPALLHRLLLLDPQNSTAHGMAGVLAFDAGDCHAAIPHFEQSQISATSNSDAYSLYGACLIKQHRPNEAASVFSSLLETHPHSFNVRFDLGCAQLLAKQPENAVLTLEPFADDDKTGEGLGLLATAEIAAGKFDAAVAHLRKALELNPKLEQNYLDLAGICIDHETLSNAEKVVDIGLWNIPNSSRLHALKGVIAAERGQNEEALKEFDRANKLDSREEYGAAGLGTLYLESNQPQAAVEIIQSRLRSHPEDPTLNYLLAESLMKLPGPLAHSRMATVRDALSICIRANPQSAKAHGLLGKLYVQYGSYDEAVAELELAAKYDPTARMPRSQLAIALRHLGRTGEASTVIAELKELVIQDSPQELSPK
jgi:Flp pilus assembly protein TadD